MGGEGRGEGKGGDRDSRGVRIEANSKRMAMMSRKNGCGMHKEINRKVTRTKSEPEEERKAKTEMERETKIDR